jgi:D-alanine-D-alanine ligase
MVKKIAIFCGGPSSEHEVSLSSASTIYQFIDKKKYEVYFFYISKDNNCKLLPAGPKINLKKIVATASLLKGLEDLSKKKIFAFLAGIHGEFVEDGKLQTLLEYFKIRYSGSDPSSSSLCMDKFRSTLAIYTTGILCPRSTLEEIKDSLVLPSVLSFPIIIKPNNLGSSVGVCQVSNNKELLKKALEIKSKLHVSHVILQEFIEGIELSCGVLQTKNNDFIKLPPIEIRPKKAKLFDYASKYDVGGSEEITPPTSIDKKLSDKISDAAATAHVILGCKTYSRSDFIAVDSKFYFLETNTLPGMTATSLLPQEANAFGITFPKLLDFLIENS